MIRSASIYFRFFSFLFTRRHQAPRGAGNRNTLDGRFAGSRCRWLARFSLLNGRITHSGLLVPPSPSHFSLIAQLDSLVHDANFTTSSLLHALVLSLIDQTGIHGARFLAGHIPRTPQMRRLPLAGRLDCRLGRPE